jgi:hypothetical protein
MGCAKRTRIAAPALAVAAAMNLPSPATATTLEPAASRPVVLAQAMVPPTGMMDAQHPMPMNERYLKRFPQAARVGDLIGLPVLDLNSSTLGYVQQVVRTPAGEIKFIVKYSRWWGWFGRPVAVPLEALGIEGRQLVSLDMPPSEYAAAPTWHNTGATPLPADATARVALARN